MEFFRKRVIKFAVVLVFVCCMLFVNFVSIKMIIRYGVDTYFYDKLLVAYNIGGSEGLKLELSKISVTDKSPREQMLAKDFAVQIETLTDPGRFLQDKVDKSKSKINSIKILRSAAIYILIILFALRAIINFMNKPKTKIRR